MYLRIYLSMNSGEERVIWPPGEIKRPGNRCSDAGNFSPARSQITWLVGIFLTAADTTFTPAGLIPPHNTGPATFFRPLTMSNQPILNFITLVTHWMNGQLTSSSNSSYWVNDMPDTAFVVKIVFPQRNIKVRIQVSSAGCLGVRQHLDLSLCHRKILCLNFIYPHRFLPVKCFLVNLRWEVS